MISRGSPIIKIQIHDKNPSKFSPLVMPFLLEISPFCEDTASPTLVTDFAVVTVEWRTCWLPFFDSCNPDWVLIEDSSSVVGCTDFRMFSCSFLTGAGEGCCWICGFDASRFSFSFPIRRSSDRFFTSVRTSKIIKM